MIFERDFKREFDWRGKRLRVGFLLPESRTKIAAGPMTKSRSIYRSRQRRWLGHVVISISCF